MALWCLLGATATSSSWLMAGDDPAPFKKESELPVVARLQLADTNFALGQGVPIELVVSNRSDAAIRLAEVRSWDWDFPLAKLQIKDPDGQAPVRIKPSYEAYDGFNGSVKHTLLPPKGQKGWSMNICSRHMLTNTGAYSVSARISVPAQAGGLRATQIETSPIFFGIRAPLTNGTGKLP
jgi:hypothetical protein